MERLRLEKKEIEVLPPLPKEKGKSPNHINGRFAPGHKAGIGNPGPSKRNWMTQELISQLNELDPRTNKPKYGALVEQLIKNALDRYEMVEVITKRGIKKKVRQFVAGDQKALEYIFDRIEGRPKQNMGIEGDDVGGKLTLIFEPIDREL